MRSEQAEKFLPLMALGIQALSLINKAAGIASMLYPVVPGSPIPKALLDKAETFFAYSNNCGVIEKMKEEGSTASKTVRGCELKEFSKFLKEKDADGTFSGLRRVCDKSSGNAMWTIEATAKSIEEENENEKREEVTQPKAELSDLKQNKRNESVHEETEEMSRLKEELQRQACEITCLKQKIETPEEQQIDATCCVIL